MCMADYGNDSPVGGVVGMADLRAGVVVDIGGACWCGVSGVLVEWREEVVHRWGWGLTFGVARKHYLA